MKFQTKSQTHYKRLNKETITKSKNIRNQKKEEYPIEISSKTTTALQNYNEQSNRDQVEGGSRRKSKSGKMKKKGRT